MTSYQFALLRYRHSATSGERVNIGVVMWLPTDRRMLAAVNERYARLSQLFQASFDAPSYVQMVRHLTSRFSQVNREIAGAQLDFLERLPETLPELLQALVPNPDSCFEWSLIMAGLTTDPQIRLRELMQEFVEQHEGVGVRTRREDEDVWIGVERRLRERDLLSTGRVQTNLEVKTSNYSWVFKSGWRNGIPQVMEPISLDYVNSSQVVERAVTWSGRLFQLSREQVFGMTAILGRPRRQENMPAYGRARDILAAAPSVRRVIDEDEFDTVVSEIERDLREHAG